jgi:hypothetical protein
MLLQFLVEVCELRAPIKAPPSYIVQLKISPWHTPVVVIKLLSKSDFLPGGYIFPSSEKPGGKF